jgi:hypothetical protein
VRHHEIGYAANAMTVLTLPTPMSTPPAVSCRHNGVTLCYCRERDPRWPYNLYCWSRRRATSADVSTTRLQTTARPAHAVLFSHKQFKQQGRALQTAAEAPRPIRSEVPDRLTASTRPRRPLAGDTASESRLPIGAELVVRRRRHRTPAAPSAHGVLTRFGPLFRSSAGGRPCAALESQHELDRVAAIVNALPEVAQLQARAPAQHGFVIAAPQPRIEPAPHRAAGRISAPFRRSASTASAYLSPRG